MKHVETLADQLVKLDVTELNHLVEYLKNSYGLEPTQMIIQQSEGNNTEANDGTPKYYAMKIITPGEGKLKVVKELNAITSIGLIKAKSKVESDSPILLNKTIVELEEAGKLFQEISVGFTMEIVESETPWKED